MDDREASSGWIPARVAPGSSVVSSWRRATECGKVVAEVFLDEDGGTSGAVLGTDEHVQRSLSFSDLGQLETAFGAVWDLAVLVSGLLELLAKEELSAAPLSSPRGR